MAGISYVTTKIERENSRNAIILILIWIRTYNTFESKLCIYQDEYSETFVREELKDNFFQCYHCSGNDFHGMISSYFFSTSI